MLFKDSSILHNKVYMLLEKSKGTLNCHSIKPSQLAAGISISHIYNLDQPDKGRNFELDRCEFSYINRNKRVVEEWLRM